ncbi:GLPGLI family protein [Litoribaculum gwangyangense]|uniref:GLPGLI family protein n=1 Tax=Litoribaculum gwangyangense TaxID=1130722 RepID=A0ABP9BV20_9FLAO
MNFFLKTIGLLTVLIISNGLFAQDFQGIATYKSHRKVDLKMDDKNTNSEMQKQIQEQLKKQFQQEYTLEFNKNESIYKRVEKLDKPSIPNSSGITIKISQSSDIMYKNIQDHRYTNKTEISGKIFLVKDSLKNKKWQLLNETKYIGEYACFKAVFEEEYTTKTITSDGKFEDVTKEKTTTVWYTPQIPVSHGPEDYFGLPGLILEVNDGELTLICSKIVINPKETFEIKEPEKGKEVSQKEFNDIQERKNKEMMEQFQSRRGSREGETFMIRVGS